MKYRFKNRGFSSFEIVLYIGLIGIFCSFILPILNTTQKINSIIIDTNLNDNNEETFVDIIEELIRDASGEKMNIYGIELSRNAYVFDYPKSFGGKNGRFLKQDFFQSMSSTGNTLFIKSFKSDGKKIKKYFTLLQFYEMKGINELIIYECKYSLGEIELGKKNVLLWNATGKFIENSTGIFIILKQLDRSGKERRVLYGYENFSY